MNNNHHTRRAIRNERADVIREREAIITELIPDLTPEERTNLTPERLAQAIMQEHNSSPEDALTLAQRILAIGATLEEADSITHFTELSSESSGSFSDIPPQQRITRSQTNNGGNLAFQQLPQNFRM